MLFVILLFVFQPSYSSNETVIYSLESQVSDIRKTIEHSQSFLNETPSDPAYITVIESDLRLLQEKVNRFGTLLKSTSYPPPSPHLESP
jgi:hypothetical protein